MDTVKLVYPCKCQLTPVNSPFSDFSRNTKGFAQAIIRGGELYRERGLYYPTVMYCERPTGGGLKGVTRELVIEFSVPKLLCGNNLYEYDEKSFGLVVVTLHERLLDMGFEFITENEIPVLYVRRMDVGKNVLMKSRLAVNNAIRSIAAADITKHLDFGDTDYANGGRLVRYHSVNEDVTFYDKGKDLERSVVSERKSVDSDAFAIDGIAVTPKKLNVLRFEIKMLGKKTIERRMNAVGLSTPASWEFRHLFKNDFCQKLLQGRMDEIYGAIPKIPLDGDSTLSILENLVEDEAKKGIRGGTMRVLARLGVQVLLRDGVAQREIDTLIEEAFGASGRETLKRARCSPSAHQLKNLRMIKEAVDKFVMLKSSDIETLLCQ